MNVHAPALADAHRFDDHASAFADDVIDNLSQHPKRLSPKYFYDAASQRWMVAHPEGTDGGGNGAPAPADVSKTTIGGLPMLPSGARFDTTVIPLSPTQFVVVQDGGGSAFTNELARTVAAAGAHVDAKTLAAALRAEAIAYEKQSQTTISPETLCLLQSSLCKK